MGPAGPKCHPSCGPAGVDLQALLMGSLWGSEKSRDLEKISLLERVLVAPGPLI